MLALAPAANAARLGTAHDDAVLDGLVSAIAGPVPVSPVLRAALRRDFAQEYGAPALWRLVEHFGHNGIASVLEPQPDEIEGQVRWIALYLFTGSANPSVATAPMVNYPHALGWKSLRFAKAPGLCAGPEFGYWLKPWEAA
ncbi:hypothetical protein [Hoeflea ulvae]|uniref:Gluconate 2-dehydrogenase subunit 3 family protein n=1 Tax=Hoeflea ulvae TaxID=2983764 RepID=A0ABT3YLT3_9HYPH|nr:hypothetical protein [Hoeflea ulvae]MCY0096863.1 hypothetical protein [Hoeflea ulvae]